LLTAGLGAVAVAVARVPVAVVAGAFGLVIGSFLNVVVYRAPRRLSVVRPGSFCPACRTPIRPADNVPLVSWLVLRGRCRVCGAPISPRYPAVEASTAGVFGVLAWGLGPHWAVPGMCVLAATLLALAVIELDGLPAPPRETMVGSAAGIVLLAVAAVADRRWWHLGGALLGATAGAALVVGLAAAARRGKRTTVPWAALPGGTVVGWVGVTGVAVGIPVAVVAFGVAALYRARRSKVGGDISGVALAAVLGCTAALVAALVAGQPVGR